MSDNIVTCAKFKEELPGLKAAPFSGSLGEEIKSRVSERAWRMWSEDLQIKVINEYRLNLADPNDYKKLVDQMRIFLGLDNNGLEELTVGDPDKAKSKS